MKNEGKRISGDSQNTSPQKKSSLDGFFAIKRVIIKMKIGEEEEIGWLILK